ncbi:MAG: mannose-1-phosphate guanylyltransferase [Melioribacteraceae bacterium]|nr:MAG: mannose-1-phosphate guanylyltransferase [Melioribacteraceae bacterium]
MVDMQKKIEKIVVPANSTILDALKKMDDLQRRLLLVFDREKYVNLLSVGDLQRAIIKNFPLDTKVTKILRTETKVCRSDESIESIKAKMFKFRTECMPVLDMDENLVEVYFWEDMFPYEEKRVEHNLKLPVIIMAGGKGSRLKPLTNVLPKPLIPIGNKTILENIMDRFVSSGCTDFYLSVNYKSEMIRQYFESLGNNDYQIKYFEEDKPLGTAGSLFMLNGRIDKTFFISNCDILIEEDYSEIYKYHREHKNELTIVAALKHYPIPYGTIETGEEGRLIKLTEKPELTFKINSGMYILEPHLLKEIPANEFFHITELIEKIRAREGRIGVFPVSEKSWKDIGEWDEYLRSLNIK